MFATRALAGARRRRLRRRTRWWLPLLLVAAFVMSASAANAYWTSTGNGPGGGATGVSGALVLTPGSPSTALRPGGRAHVVLTISNPGTAAADVRSLALDVTQGSAGLGVDADHVACDTSSMHFMTQTTGWHVPGRAGSADGTLAVVLPSSISMDLDAMNACQGARVVVHLRASS